MFNHRPGLAICTVGYDRPRDMLCVDSMADTEGGDQLFMDYGRGNANYFTQAGFLQQRQDNQHDTHTLSITLMPLAHEPAASVPAAEFGGLLSLKAMILYKAGIRPVNPPPSGSTLGAEDALFQFEFGMDGVPPTRLQCVLWVRSLDKGALGGFLKAAGPQGIASDFSWNAYCETHPVVRGTVGKAFRAHCEEAFGALPGNEERTRRRPEAGAAAGAIMDDTDAASYKRQLLRQARVIGENVLLAGIAWGGGRRSRGVAGDGG
jgi:hypothetical protein